MTNKLKMGSHHATAETGKINSNNMDNNPLNTDSMNTTKEKTGQNSSKQIKRPKLK